MNSEEGGWILAFIAMVGAVLSLLIKMIAKNGCRLRCYHSTGQVCCDTDCDEGPAADTPLKKNPVYTVNDPPSP